MFVTHKDTMGWAHEALTHPDADVRRRAINRLAESRHLSDPPILKTLGLVGRTDRNAAVRRAAIRALAQQSCPESVDAMLAILDEPDKHEEVVPPGDSVRWAAIDGLLETAPLRRWDEQREEAMRVTSIRLLGSDPSREVRLAAARLLGHYPSSATLRTLIAALSERDFGIVYESERSLMRLTGRTHEHDPARWETWLNSTADPFADRNRLDHLLDEPAREAEWLPWRKSWWPGKESS